MKLSISLAAAAIILRFTTPGPGCWYVYSTADHVRYQVEASGHVWIGSHVAVPVPPAAAHKTFIVRFDKHFPWTTNNP
jgi:hypothetical protein